MSHSERHRGRRIGAVQSQKASIASRKASQIYSRANDVIGHSCSYHGLSIRNWRPIRLGRRRQSMLCQPISEPLDMDVGPAIRQILRLAARKSTVI